jgi:hypothetical protein
MLYMHRPAEGDYIVHICHSSSLHEMKKSWTLVSAYQKQARARGYNFAAEQTCPSQWHICDDHHGWVSVLATWHLIMREIFSSFSISLVFFPFLVCHKSKCVRDIELHRVVVVVGSKGHQYTPSSASSAWAIPRLCNQFPVLARLHISNICGAELDGTKHH